MKIWIQMLMAIAIVLSPMAKAKDWEEAHLWNFKNVYLIPSENAALARIEKVWVEDPLDPSDKIHIYFEAIVIEEIKGELKENMSIQFFEVFEDLPKNEKLETWQGDLFYLFPHQLSEEFFVDVGERWPRAAWAAEAVEEWKSSDSNAMRSTETSSAE